MEYIFNPVPNSGLNNIVKAKDMYYTDSNGKQYIDLESGVWCTALGHNNDSINNFIKNQIDDLTHVGKRILPDEIDQIAKKIVDITHIEGKAIFLSSGSEAVEFSLTMAEKKNKKGKRVTFTDNFLSSYGKANDINEKINIKRCLNCEKECSLNCNVIKNKIADETIFIFDPFCFSRLVIEPPVKLIQTICNELKRKNGILISNEVTSGLGRTGKWFAFEHFNISPDMVVMGKTLGNGYPVSCVVIKKSIIDAAEKSGFIYCQSHQNDPLGCKIAEKVIETLMEKKLIQRSNDLGKELLILLKRDLYIEGVKDIRGKGLMIGIEICKDLPVGEIFYKLLKKGIIIGVSTKYNMLNIFPPYIINDNLLAEISLKIRESIIEVRNRLSKAL